MLDKQKKCHDSVHDNLYKVFLDNGINVLIQMATGLLNGAGLGKELQAQVNGEVCEVVLECLIIDYSLKHKEECSDWLLYKGLIIKDRDNLRSAFSTEIDLTLITPQCIYLFECKSYKGDNLLTGLGKYKNTDVFSQNMLHLKTLDKWVKPFTINGKNPVYKIALFAFSNGSITDNRDLSVKKSMPVLTLQNWTDILLSNSSQKVWNMKSVKTLFDQLESNTEKLYYEHLNYVKSIH